MAKEKGPNWADVEDAAKAKALGVSKSTVYKLTHNNEVSLTYRKGRVWDAGVFMIDLNTVPTRYRK